MPSFDIFGGAAEVGRTPDGGEDVPTRRRRGRTRDRGRRCDTRSSERRRHSAGSDRPDRLVPHHGFDRPRPTAAGRIRRIRHGRRTRPRRPLLPLPPHDGTEMPGSERQSRFTTRARGMEDGDDLPPRKPPPLAQIEKVQMPHDDPIQSDLAGGAGEIAGDRLRTLPDQPVRLAHRLRFPLSDRRRRWDPDHHRDRNPPNPHLSKPSGPAMPKRDGAAGSGPDGLSSPPRSESQWTFWITHASVETPEPDRQIFNIFIFLRQAHFLFLLEFFY